MRACVRACVRVYVCMNVYVVRMFDNVICHIIFIIIMISKPNFDYVILPNVFYFLI